MDNLEQVYQEGIFDRMKARGAGLVGGAKTIGQNIGKVFKGGQMASVRDAATQAKLSSITQTFQNEMAALFGGNWATQYPNLANELTTLQTATPAAPTPTPATPAPATPTPAAPTTPAVDKSKPLVKDQLVTGAGKYNKTKYKVVADKGTTVTVQPISRKGQPYSKPIDVDRQTELVESKKQKITIDEAYNALKEVPKL